MICVSWFICFYRQRDFPHCQDTTVGMQGLPRISCWMLNQISRSCGHQSRGQKSRGTPSLPRILLYSTPKAENEEVLASPAMARVPSSVFRKVSSPFKDDLV